MMVPPFWDGGYPLVAPQGAGPGAGIAIDPQAVAPAGIALHGAVLCLRLRLLPPREAGRQLRERGEREVGQRLSEVLQREKEHSSLPLGCRGTGRRQQDTEGYSSQESFPAFRAQGLAQSSHGISPSY